MAEPTSVPALPSTSDPVPYVPVSWIAVAASSVANLYIAILVSLGIAAFLAKKPLVQAELLAIPAVGVVLSFAARRVIRNAEGTRTGENLANTAWWICVIAGLGYAAYLLAIDFAIRRDAKNELERWVENIKAGDERSFNSAFLRTRDPAQRSSISPEDTAQIEARFREEYLGFKQCDLVRIVQRNKGACEFVAGAVKEWSYRGGGIECSYSGVLKCPEGTFPVTVALRGGESTGGEAMGRQWGVMFSPSTGFVVRDRASLTRYGWLLQTVEQSGSEFGNQFVMNARAGQWAVPYTYHLMMKEVVQPSPLYWSTAILSLHGRLAVAGGLGAVPPYTPDYLAYSFPDQFYKGHGGKEPTGEQRAQFKIVWETAGLLPPGTRLRNSPDVYPALTVTDTAVEVRVPCELPFTGQDTASTARGRVVVVSTDPNLLSELKRLREEANPDAGLPSPGEDFRQRSFKWRVVRLESDMVKVQVQQRPEPGAPPPTP